MADMIGKTDSITLITAKPGSGKTLRLVRFIRDAIDQGETVFVCNLNGLKLPHVPLDDPREWQTLPAGSVLVVDEAQQFFRARRGGEPRAYITAMETIRHRGIRLVLATQQPDYLDSHIRGLVGLHEHMVRVHGKEAAKIWRHTEVMENVRGERAKARYDSEEWQFDKTLYALYDSAEVHTIKPVMSARWKRGLFLLAAAAILLVGGLSWARKSYDKFDSDAAGSVDGGPKPAVVPAPQGAGATGRAMRTPEEYAISLIPRVPEMPWSAPAFDDRAVIAEPIVICAIGGAGSLSTGGNRASECHCMTEQGTMYILQDDDTRSGDARCRHIARWGQPYNVHKAPAIQGLQGLAPAETSVPAQQDSDAKVRAVMNAPVPDTAT